MLKKIFALVALGLMVLIPASVLISANVVSAQGPTRTPTASGLGGFLGGAQTASTPTPTTNDPVKQALAKDNYVVFTSGNWYDEAGKSVPNSAHVFMLAAAADPKSDLGVKQIASGFAALRSTYPNATSYHVLLLSGPNVHDASTTSQALQLLNTQLITAEAWLKDVLNGVRTINLVKGSTSTTTTNPPATPVKPQATATRVPTRRPTQAPSGCAAPAGKARLTVFNGYNGVMRFTIGGGEWGTHDYDIQANQRGFIDMPPGRYTYTAFIPGIGKANGDRKDYVAGVCYELSFTP